MLPASVRVIVRDWLNANHVLITGRSATVLVDSGYGRDAHETLGLVSQALSGRRLDLLVNTHCHSDHMGGNAAIRRAHRCRISIPRDEAPLIEAWDDRALWLSYADQRCERFDFDDTIAPGDELDWGELRWRAIAAPGHDMAALMFHCEQAGVLISGDALWENGFGIVLPGEGCGERLAAARATLETIAALGVRAVIPGHGRPFGDVGAALRRSLLRLDAFERDEGRVVRHVLKVMFVFSLLDRRGLAEKDLDAYFDSVPLYEDFNRRFLGLDRASLVDLVVGDLERRGAVRRHDGFLAAA
ncbi:MAG TPA: MBL fold metallo-hydrolase [Burkholderiales bacterium]|nr:MBL fold metallo-hydrolase [Burkholderiales bacterium]